MRSTGSAIFGMALLWVAAGFALAPSPAAAADDYPSKTIEVVIHTKYGGGTDTTARLLIAGAKPHLGAEMVVVAKRGGAGATAHAYLRARPADGHTVLALTQTHLYTIARGKSALKIEDLVGVARAMKDPTLIAVVAGSPFGTLQDLIAASKDSPLNWGVANIGGTEHIGLARLAKVAGIKYKVVPLGSGAQMVQQLLSGAVDVALPNVSEAVAQLENDALRGLAVMREKRLARFPAVPTSFELGYKVETATTRGYAVLKGTPQAVIDKLSRAMVQGMQEAAFVNYLASAGLSPEDSVADAAAWDNELKVTYKDSVEALRELGLLH